MDPLVTLSGLPGSPYTRKMLAVLRYRRIPYSFISRDEARVRGLPEPRVPLHPTFYMKGADGAVEAVTDSSPVIRRLEAEHSGRSVIPPGLAAAFIDMLLEDYGDEWLTKAMFHYRWVRGADIKRSTDVLPLWFGYARPDDVIAEEGRGFAERQIGRLHVVGSTAETGPLIEQSYERFIEVLNAHLREHPFLMGRRPGASDFAIFGQMTQLAGFDPTPMALTLERAPRVYAWSTFVEDLSGLEPAEADWFADESIPSTLADLLTEVGRTYAPVMIANARAVAEGADMFEASVDGKPWVQRTFPYQAKCVKWLHEAYASLDPGERWAVDTLLDGTGCEILVADEYQPWR